MSPASTERRGRLRRSQSRRSRSSPAAEKAAGALIRLRLARPSEPAGFIPPVSGSKAKPPRHVERAYVRSISEEHQTAFSPAVAIHPDSAGINPAARWGECELFVFFLVLDGGGHDLGLLVSWHDFVVAELHRE